MGIDPPLGSEDKLSPDSNQTSERGLKPMLQIRNTAKGIFDARAVDLSKNGVVRPNELEIYLKIMNLFQGFITLRITFFDIGYAAWIEEQVAMKDKISTERIRLDQSLYGSIKKINNQLADIKY